MLSPTSLNHNFSNSFYLLFLFCADVALLIIIYCSVLHCTVSCSLWLCTNYQLDALIIIYS